MIHEVLIVPGVGYCGDDGFDPGHRCRAMHEFSILEGFVRDLSDRLEYQRIRHRVLPVTNSPGIPVAQRPDHLEENQVVVNVRLGWDPPNAPGLHNWSMVRHGDGASVKLARTVTDAIGQWGRCYFFGHQTRNPQRDKKDPLLNKPGTAGLKIVPFAINGPKAWEYARKLKALAESLGWALGEYLGEDACTGKPYQGTQPAPSMAPKPSPVLSFAGLPEWVLKDPLE